MKRDLAPPGFTVLHFHRPGDGAHDRGGVAIVARDNLGVKQVSLSGKYSSVEILAAQCSTKTGRLNLVAIYRPPKSTGFFGEFESLLNEIMDLPGKLLLCGDFNCRSHVTNVDIASQLKDILIKHDLVQHVTSPTHRLGGLLDLIRAHHAQLRNRFDRSSMPELNRTRHGFFESIIASSLQP